jgi:hypothetical protein
MEKSDLSKFYRKEIQRHKHYPLQGVGKGPVSRQVSQVINQV